VREFLAAGHGVQNSARLAGIVITGTAGC
jgi:hypothetical protein